MDWGQVLAEKLKKIEDNTFYTSECLKDALELITSNNPKTKAIGYRVDIQMDKNSF